MRRLGASGFSGDHADLSNVTEGQHRTDGQVASLAPVQSVTTSFNTANGTGAGETIFIPDGSIVTGCVVRLSDPNDSVRAEVRRDGSVIYTTEYVQDNDADLDNEVPKFFSIGFEGDDVRFNEQNNQFDRSTPLEVHYVSSA